MIPLNDELRREFQYAEAMLQSLGLRENVLGPIIETDDDADVRLACVVCDGYAWLGRWRYKEFGSGADRRGFQRWGGVGNTQLIPLRDGLGSLCKRAAVAALDVDSDDTSLLVPALSTGCYWPSQERREDGQRWAACNHRRAL